METRPTALDRHKQSRLFGGERKRTSRDSSENRLEYSQRPSRKDPRNTDVRDRRNRRHIPDDQCVSLIPSAKSLSKEKISESKTPQISRNRWSENRKLPLTNSMRNQDNKLDLSKEFPPLGVSSCSITPEAHKDWGSMVEEEETRSKIKERTNPRYKRRLLLADSQEHNTQKHKTFTVDPHRLEKRQKQIDYGKNTLAYGRYIAAVQREDRTKDDPNTPDKFQGCSTRSWVGQIRIWRRKLHVWDPPTEGQEDLFSFLSQSSSMQSFPSEVKMEVDSNCDADDDMMSTSTPSSIDDLFGGFDIDACLMNDGLPL